VREDAHDRYDRANAQVVFDQANQSFHAGQFEAALGHIDKAIARYPKDGNYEVMRGRILLEMKRTDMARDAFVKVFHPFLAQEAAAVAPGTGVLSNAFFSVENGNAQFAFFDAYQTAASLEWFEAVAAKRTAEHLFVVVHPPVVPYGARATWHVFASEKEKFKREKFLELLGRQHAVVLGGHIHKYNTVARAAGGGRFAQFALSSVISGPDVTAKTPLSGLADYSGDQIKVEPKFSPDTEAARRAVYAAEKPFVKAFDYADLPGYAVVTVDGPRVTAQMYAGFSRQVWRTVDLTGLLGRMG
jgi:hypothetical protein